MKRFYLLTAVLVVGLAVVATVSMAEDDDSSEVLFTIGQFLELTVTDGEVVDFGELDPTASKAQAKNGSTLAVESNTKWSIGVDKTVTESPDDVPGSLTDRLAVRVAPPQGARDKDGIKVDYTLNDVDTLPAGDYGIEVTFTATTR